MNGFDPDNISEDVQREQALLQQRQWRPADQELLDEIKVHETAAKNAAQAAVNEIRAAMSGLRAIADAPGTAINEARVAVAKIVDDMYKARDESIAAIRAATQRSLAAAAEAAAAQTEGRRAIESVILGQIDKITQFVNARLAEASASPPPLAPIELDETFSEKDLSSVFFASLMWVAFERRQVMVLDGNRYGVDFSRASRKPPTAMAMDMLEYYVAYPEKLDRLYQQAMRLAIRGGVKPSMAKPAMAKMLPKSQDELDADNYLRSIGALPPEEQEGKGP